MKLYTLYSESHKPFFDNWFKPSLKKFNPELQLTVLSTPQSCKTGSYMDDGWLDTMIHKNEFIIHSLNQEKNNELIFHSDVDVQFFKNIQTNLDLNIFNEYDILCQADSPKVASYGVMFIKNNEKVKELFNTVLNLTKQSKNIQYYNDQNIFNMIHDRFNVKVKLLDYSYYSIWRATQGTVWTPNMILKNTIPNNLILHHSNYTTGIINKLQLMNLVKESQIS